MKNVVTVARVHTHTHTQGDLIKNNVSMKDALLIVYITDRLLI